MDVFFIDASNVNMYGVDGLAVTGETVDMKTAVGFPFPQGCTVEGQTANFSVAFPEGQTCELIIYKKGARTSAFSQKMPYSDVVGNLHFLSVVLDNLKIMNIVIKSVET